MPMLVTPTSLLSPMVSLILWLIYQCGDTVEQKMIPGDSNDNRPTDIDASITVTFAK